MISPSWFNHHIEDYITTIGGRVISLFRGLDSSCSPNISHQDAVSLRPKPEFLIVNKRICPVFQKNKDLSGKFRKQWQQWQDIAVTRALSELQQHHSGAVQAAQNQQGGFHEVIGHAQLKLHNVLPSRAGAAGERAFLCFGVREEAWRRMACQQPVRR